MMDFRPLNFEPPVGKVMDTKRRREKCSWKSNLFGSSHRKSVVELRC